MTFRDVLPPFVAGFGLGIMLCVKLLAGDASVDITQELITIEAQHDTIETLSARLLVNEGQRALLARQVIQDSIDHATWARRESELRAVERRNLLNARNTLRETLTASQDSLLTEIELAHTEIVKSFENEIRSLEVRVSSLTALVAVQDTTISTLQEINTRLEIADNTWRTIMERQNNQLAKKEAELWGTRLVAAAAAVWKLAG